MRVTGNMVTNNLLYNLQNSAERLQKYQDQISSGKRISRPSDDPRAAVTALRLRNALKETERYISNINDAKGWMQSTETALGHMTEILVRASELAGRGANDTLPPESKRALAEEIGELLKEAIQIGNSSHGGRYIFGGHNTITEPLSMSDEITCNSGYGEISREISPGITIITNISGQTAFMDGPGVLSSLKNLKIALEDAASGGDAGSVSSAMESVKESLEYVLALRANMGARINRLELNLDRLTKARIDITALLSTEEDTDVLEAAIKLATEDTAYQAGLAVGAKIIQPSLIDFLR